ncbi:MAG TPA: fumarylacetoacetate hydrolase family protein [Kofleriaceae bacterium]|nr:fumarylacetoacetate hydrolase family protein [Kofleriaceae bacterium]
MARDPDRPAWKGQRPWYEIWFAVVLDDSRRRALWLRQTFFVPRQGVGRAKIWGAWFDADAPRPTFAAKRHIAIDDVQLGEDGALIRMIDSHIAPGAAAGSVEGLAWQATWTGGRHAHSEMPSWLPAPTHARPIAYDAEASGEVTLSGPDGAQTIAIRGRASAMHIWGKRRVPTLQWIWAPWLGDSSLEVQAVSFRDTFSLGFASLRLDGPDHTYRGRPATAAHPNCLVTSTVAGARKLVHARAWAEPSQMVGYAYRDTDGRDLMVAQSDIGSAHYEVYQRKAPGAPWRLCEERRVAGGVAVEIHQHAPLPEVDYLSWEATQLSRSDAPPPGVRGTEERDWPEVTSIVALGLTYGDHARETGQKLDASAPPTSFHKHVRAFAPGDGGVRVPASADVLAALEQVEPGIGAAIADRLPMIPAVMDYEGELAVVVLGAIDEAALDAGVPQPLGLACANDLTARFCQVLGETTDRPLDYWACAKSFPGFLPVAERVWAPDGGLARLPELTLETRVNGEVRQHASTKLVMYSLAAMLRAARAHLGRPLATGDVILTGTPTGVGMRMSPITRKVASLVKDRFRKAELLVSSYANASALLRPGDVIEIDAGPAGRVRTRLTV